MQILFGNSEAENSSVTLTSLKFHLKYHPNVDSEQINTANEGSDSNSSGTHCNENVSTSQVEMHTQIVKLQAELNGE